MRKWAAPLLAFLLAASANAQEKPERFTVYYTNVAPPSAFDAYDTIVFDAEHHPELRPLQNRGKTLLGYISLGEAENYRSNFMRLKNDKLLLAQNANWGGHYYIDVREPRWAKQVIEELIPDILHQGFDGIFLDTIDSSVHLDSAKPNVPGIKDAAVRLIFAIRMHYPQIKIMLNRGFDILPQVAGSIDSVLAESVYTTYDFKEKKALKQPQAAYDSVSAMLKAEQEKHPQLKIYTLDYWPENDTAEVKKIYGIQRASGFVPYVATPDLQKLVPEPK